jgi:hypothetical protein
VDLHRVYDTYRDRANFITIYISEAHPDDEWQMDSNRAEKLVFNQPKTFDERKKLAGILVERLHYRMPVAIDSLTNDADRAFSGWPERIYVLERGGKVVFKGGLGPFGFDIGKAEQALAALVASRSKL